jgi:hypothetical protein
MSNSTIKETPTTSRQDIWAKLRYGNVPSWVQKFTRKLQMSNQNEQKERKHSHSQTCRMKNSEELQLNHDHEKFLFLNVLLLFAQFKMHYWWLVTWLELSTETYTKTRWANKIKIKKKEIHIVRPAGLKIRRSFSYTIITKNSCFDCAVALSTMKNELMLISNLTWLDFTLERR